VLYVNYEICCNNCLVILLNIFPRSFQEKALKSSIEQPIDPNPMNPTTQHTATKEITVINLCDDDDSLPSSETLSPDLGTSIPQPNLQTDLLPLPKTSPPTAEKLISKAELLLSRCKKELNNLNNEDNKTNINTTNDDSFSLFGVDDDDIFEGELMKVDETVICSPVKSTAITGAASFFNTICPDLLRSSPTEATPRNKRRGRKRPSDVSEHTSSITTPLKKSIKTSDVSVGVSSLLKEKQLEIEERRKEALARRYNSLIRQRPSSFEG